MKAYKGAASIVEAQKASNAALDRLFEKSVGEKHEIIDVDIQEEGAAVLILVQLLGEHEPLKLATSVADSKPREAFALDTSVE